MMRLTLFVLAAFGLTVLFGYLSRDGTNTAGVFVLLLILAGVLGVRRRKPSGPTPLALGVRALNRGRYSEALEIFQRLAAVAPRDPIVHFDLGVTRLQLWQLDRARAALDVAWAGRTEAGDFSTQLLSLVPENMALVAALSGRAEEAARWLSAVPEQDADPARAALVRGVLAAKAGEWSGAREFLAPFEVKQLGGALGGLARVLDAMAIEGLTGERRHIDRVALYGETGPEALRPHWPELVEFVNRTPAW
jgi:tetratricopeptide (TPR) repeat protein